MWQRILDFLDPRRPTAGPEPWKHFVSRPDRTPERMFFWLILLGLLAWAAAIVGMLWLIGSI
jgi:hypothetical protein